MSLADEIVDIVDTGKTLVANGLEPVDFIADISSRLVVNKASMKVKYDQLKSLTDLIAEPLAIINYVVSKKSSGATFFMTTNMQPKLSPRRLSANDQILAMILPS